MAQDAPRTARERARAEITTEILDTARTHLIADGAAALSLRAVARDLGMVSSAVYRYVPNRDALLTMLIVDLYESGAVVPAADISPAVAASISPIQSYVSGRLPDDLMLRGMAAWSALFGAVSFELYGHLHNVVTDSVRARKAYFDHQMSQVASGLGLASR